MLTEDMSAFFRVDGFAKAATWDGIPAAVIVDMPTEDLFDGGDMKVIAQQLEVTLPTDSWPGIARGAQVIIEGTTYVVREVRKLDDGAIKRMRLSK